MPAATDLDPLEIPRLLPVSLIAEMTHFGPRMRLLGSESTAAYGAEVRGKLVSEIDFGKFTSAWREAFEFVLSAKAPAAAGGGFEAARGAQVVELVLLPLSTDGVTIDRIFGGLVLCPEPRHAAMPQRSPKNFVARVAEDPNVACVRSERCGL